MPSTARPPCHPALNGKKDGALDRLLSDATDFPLGGVRVGWSVESAWGIHPMENFSYALNIERLLPVYESASSDSGG
jgi:hypothetical protein